MNRTCVKCGDINLQASGEPMEACPACGAIYSKAKSAAVPQQVAAGPVRALRRAETLLSVLIAAAALWALSPLWRGHDRAINDARERYAIAKTGGSAMEACVQAGIVATALLNAKRGDEYAAWKRVEQDDCRRASMLR
ncbi:MAG TPA: hypothetical protein PKE15_00105 [Ottowia sp.]|nr:hypothetical protein [Ottowia sp.]